MRANANFLRRCQERGITETDTAELFELLYWAITTGQEDVAQPCLSFGGSAHYRFCCKEGVFYAITKDSTGVPVTVMTQKMFSQNRASHKRHRQRERSQRKFKPSRSRWRENAGNGG